MIRAGTGWFIVGFLTAFFFVGPGSAAADVPTWDPEPATPVEEETPPSEEDAAPGQESPPEPTASSGPEWINLYGSVAEFNRLRAPELVFLPGVELAAFQAFHGFATGNLICEWRRCGEMGRLGWVGGSMALGAGASLAAHYFLDLAPGQVAAANSGFIYGYITSFIIAEFFTSTREWERALILGGLGGVAAGALIGTGLRLTAGDVALVNLGFLMSLLTVFVLDEFAWGTAVGSLLLRNEMVFLGFLMASMTAGGVVARLYPMDRIRVRMIGTGGILTALAFGFFTAVATNSDAAVLASMLLGTTAGMAGVGYATRGLDAHFRHSPDDPLLGRWQPGLAPTLDGRGATFSLTGRF